MRVSEQELRAVVFAPREPTRRRLALLLSAGGIDVPPPVRSDGGTDEGAPDVVVIACSPGTADAKREIRDLKRRFPQVPVVAIVPGGSAKRVTQGALEANAEGIVYRSQIAQALVPTVRAVGARQVVIPEPEYRRSQPVTLSFRERQVLRLAVEGLTNDAIASELYVSRSTVKSHLTSAFAKLSVRSRSEAAVILLDPNEPASRLVFNELGNDNPIPSAASGGG
ncbi:MAG TPA: response regulator transcription factor [Solirubrobacterales bacterium]|nr:response regulator transcription factor [Solirubrobacterales bacterium]